MRTDRLPLGRIDENATMNSRSGSRSRLLQGIGGINPLNTSMASKGDLSVISQSNRLEESVKAPGRPPELIEDLIDFLIDESYRKYGVYPKVTELEAGKSSLFKFWKDFISVHYRITNRNKEEKSFYDKSIIT
jgi:hypothetical protein